MSKELIVYFSRKGYNYVNGSIRYLSVRNTEIVAKMIQEMTGADLFQIEPVIEYDTDYHACIEESKRDLRTNAKPELRNAPTSRAEYDIIYLNYPNYWGTMPMHVWTFWRNMILQGK